MTATAVVVRWKGGDEVDRCLSSLLSQAGGSLGNVVLVDSGSGDGGADRLAAAFPDVEVVALGENRSFAHAANAGAATTTDDLIFLLNPDTELEDGSVGTLIEALKLRPRAAGVVPLLVNPDGSAQHRWQLRRLPSTTRLATGRPGAPAFSSPPMTAVTVEQPAAAAWMIRRDVWSALDGLDEGFVPAWWEDVDFCARMNARLDEPGFPADCGFEVIPEARVRHQGGSSLQSLNDTSFLTAYTTNLLRYATRHHADRLALIRTGIRCSLTAKALLHPSRARAYRAARRELGRRGSP